MKALGFVIGGIAVLLILAVSFSFIQKDQAAKKELKESSKLQENVLGKMVTSEEKIQEAQKLLSKKESKIEDQAKARDLIDEALAEARKAAEAQPDNPRTWYYLSEQYQKLRDVNPKAADFSIEALNNAIALTPKDTKLLNERATMYIFKKKYKEAEKDLKQAIQFDINGASHYYKLGNVYKSIGEKELARTMYLQAKTLTSSENKMALAQIEYQLKELEKKSSSSANINKK